MQSGGASISLIFQVMRKSQIIFESFGKMILSNDKTILQISVLSGNDAAYAWSSNDCFYFFITSISICPAFELCVCARACVSVFSLGWVKKNDTDITKQAPCFQTRQYAVILLYHKSVFNDYAFTVQFDSILSNFSIAHTKLSDRATVWRRQRAANWWAEQGKWERKTSIIRFLVQYNIFPMVVRNLSN